MSAKYACITAHRRAYSVRLMCRVLELSPAAYYAGRARPASARGRRDAGLTPQIHAIHHTSRGTYGAPRVHQALRARGECVSRKRVARLMRGAHLAGKTARRWRTTPPTARDAACPNHLARAFAPSVVGQQVFASYLKTYEPSVNPVDSAGYASVSYHFSEALIAAAVPEPQTSTH